MDVLASDSSITVILCFYKSFAVFYDLQKCSRWNYPVVLLNSILSRTSYSYGNKICPVFFYYSCIRNESREIMFWACKCCSQNFIMIFVCAEERLIDIKRK